MKIRKMDSSVVCRACLSSCVGMYYIADTGFQDTFEAILDIKITRDDGKPQTVCYICCSLLQRFYNFTAMAKRSDRVLRHFLGLGVQITRHTVSHLYPRKPKLSYTRLNSISINSSETPVPDEDIKKIVVELDSNVYASVVEISDVLRDFENCTDDIKIEGNQTCDDAMNLEHAVTTTLKVEQRDNDSFVNLEQSPKTGLILESNEQSVVKDECEPDTCSDNEEMPLVIDDMESINFENLQQTSINKKQFEPCAVTELVDKKQLLTNNSGVTIENKPTEENNINAIFQPLFGCMSNHDGQSPSKELKIRSTTSRLKPSDLGIHRESESEEESDDDDDGPPFAKKGQRSDPLEMSETKGGTTTNGLFLSNDGDKNRGHCCYECFASFSTKTNLRSHMEKEHFELYKCLKCDMEFHKPKHIRDHYKSRHPGSRYVANPCDMCHKRYKSRKRLVIHKRVRHIDPITLFSCDTCGKKFEDHSSYRNHILCDHPSDSTKTLKLFQAC